MKDVINYFATIESGFKRMKFIVWAILGFSLVFILGVTFIAFSSVQASQDRLYVLDRGQAFSASLSSGEDWRDIEIHDHVSRFHELMFRLSPSKEAIERNVERALNMCDKSAYDFYMDFAEKEHYSRLIKANISQDFSLDSLIVNVNTYPYSARTYGKLYIIRENSITAYDLESSCNLIDVERTQSNPHGLMMEKFKLEKSEKIETRKRR